MLFRGMDVIFVVNLANAFHCVLPRMLGEADGDQCGRAGLEEEEKWGALAKKYFYWNAKNVGRICPKGVVTDAREMQRIYLEEFMVREV